MADLEDVTAKLVSIISGTLYPNGVSNPPVSGFASRVLAGWPQPAQQDADMKAGITEVSVYPRPEERNTTRYLLDEWVPVTLPVITLFLAVNGDVVAVGGTVSVPQNVMLMVNGLPYIYGVKASDTLASVAAALAALIPGATSSAGTAWSADSMMVTADSSGFTADGAGVGSGGALITVPATANITAARVGGSGSSVLEIRRQERLFQIGIWANSPKARTAIAKAIDPVLANMPFIALPDFSMGRLRYKSSFVSDANQKQLLYRRDLFYTVEYATTLTDETAQIMTLGIQPSVGVAPPYTQIATENI